MENVNEKVIDLNEHKKKKTSKINVVKSMFMGACVVTKKAAEDFWQENGRVIKIGANCLAAGLLYGYVKGYCSGNSSVWSMTERLVDKIPDLPAPDDIDPADILRGMIKSDIDELVKELIEQGDVEDR